MKRICIISILTILILLVMFIKKDSKILKIDGIKYAVYVNGTRTNNFPAKDSYKVTVSCDNASARWDYEEWIVEIYDATGTVSCDISFTTTTKVTFNNYIINLLNGETTVASESTAGNGSTLELINSPLPTSGTSTDYRYRGINPANYVRFNNELWRIIGVFDENSHDIADTKLVKLIKNESIGGYVWDNDASLGPYGRNNYPDSDIYNILNKAYYNNTSATALPIDATGQEYCYAGQTTLTGKCNFTKIGIQPEYKRMVEDGVTWYLGGMDSQTAKASAFYTVERTNTSKFTDNVATITAPIGLMYASDYGYAAPAACDDTNIESFSSSITINNVATTCAVHDWLKSNFYEWTITHHSSTSFRVFSLSNSGNLIGNYPACNGYVTRPVLYLDSSVYYLSGTGTQTDPYIIAMD